MILYQELHLFYKDINFLENQEMIVTNLSLILTQFIIQIKIKWFEKRCLS